MIPPGRIKMQIWKKNNKEKVKEYNKKYKEKRKIIQKKDQIFVGVDGEGQTVEGVHRYILLCVSDKSCEHKHFIYNENGLSTIEIFEFLLSLNEKYKFFSFGFSYDLTKMLENLDNESLYKLLRPELRKTKTGQTHPIKWNDYRINLMNTRFTLKKDNKKITINDIVKFYQSTFAKALRLWKAAPIEVIERIEKMKDKRNVFFNESIEDIKEYCFEECKYMAILAQMLTDAHEVAQIPLKNYYGAGSSASSMLSVMGIKDIIKKVRENALEDELMDAIMCGYFGGRFEVGYIGKVPQTIHSWDISSAYPYQIYNLPCLIHGKWYHTTNYNDIINSTTAIVKYKLHKPSKELLWAPFPFRDENGNIICPEYSGGGWIWKDEFLQGEKIFPNVEFIEAYIYNTDCNCHPFHKIAEYYVERCKLGKEGAGIVLKLGCNSVYGKLAQSVGGQYGQFTNWVWAGMITSGCRAQLLELMGKHNDINNVIMVATDGLFSFENVVPPIPIETNTSQTGKPLGGWEYKNYPNGMFLGRVGIYFPLDDTDVEYKQFRARGLGRKELSENRNKVMSEWENKTKEVVVIKDKFHGAKSSITKDTNGYNRSPLYGKWSKDERTNSFNPMPKRKGFHGNQLLLRSFPGTESYPYTKGIPNLQTALLNIDKTIQEEQPV